MIDVFGWLLFMTAYSPQGAGGGGLELFSTDECAQGTIEG